MNDTTSQPRSTIFCLTGILASLLLIIGFLGEGNARTFPEFQDVSSQSQESYYNWEGTTLQTITPTTKEKRELTRLPTHHLNPDKDTQQEKERIDKKDQPLKKRMGLALLFLGILAEQG